MCIRDRFSHARLKELLDDGKPVLVDATASWCLTCKVNEKVALSSQEMQDYLAKYDVTLLIADWTSYDAGITEYLASFGRNGVPLYVYYPAYGQAHVLPQLLTPAIVRDAIDPAHE